jgi:hypothetical protein
MATAMQARNWRTAAAAAGLCLILPCCKILLTQNLLNQKDSQNCKFTFYSDYKISPTYWESLDSIERNQHFDPPCAFQFTKRTFSVVKLLNKGANAIFLLDNGEVLRMANLQTQSNDLFDYFKIYQDLSAHQVPVVRTTIDDYPQDRIEYLRHGYIEIQFTLKEFLSRENSMPKNDIEKIELKFIQFAQTLSPYIYIADLHDQNIVYTKQNGWISLDFGASDQEKYTYHPQELFIHIEPSQKQIERIKSVYSQIHSGSPQKQLETIREKGDLYKILSENTRTSPDPAIAQYLILPTNLKIKIDDAIALSRLRKFGSK